MNTLITFTLALILPFSAIATSLKLTVLEFDPGTIIDFYGIPNKLELELHVQVVGVPLESSEDPNSAFILDIFDDELYPKKLLFKVSLSEDGNSPVMLSAAAVLKQAKSLQAQYNPKELYLFFSLVEKSKGRVCFFEACDVNVSKHNITKLREFRTQLLRTVQSGQNKWTFLKSEEELMRQLSQKQRNSVNEKVMQFMESNQLIALKHILKTDVSSEVTESFWLQNNAFSLFQYSLYGEISRD